MRKRKFRKTEYLCRRPVMPVCEADASLLDLLCEDGFLTPAELPAEDSSVVQLMLLRRAVRRGFLTAGDPAEEADMLLVSYLDSLRIWTDLTDEDVHLRAPPRCA